MTWYLWLILSLILWFVLMDLTVIGKMFLMKSSWFKSTKEATWHYCFTWILGIFLIVAVPIMGTILMPKHILKYFKKKKKRN